MRSVPHRGRRGVTGAPAARPIAASRTIALTWEVAMSGSDEGPAGIDQGEAPWRRGPLATLAVLAVSFALVATTLVGLAPREAPSPSPRPPPTPIPPPTP